MYKCVNECVEARGQLSVLFPRAVYLVYWDRVSSWDLIRLDWLACKPQGSACLDVLNAGITSVHHHS